ncbi:beta-lactamase/transpeptidase-like protein [Coprinellus micaceus]|uniref:Beta-lactamase/transpeptidase-like protein n=1 Tax=Coprinellus micaceus TaxID=71717 RepID=A0A4Y7T693_COPMI|nr:beta-lactamase/transpeptidase-like protein [Coprinellus micaceus]
MKSTRLLRLAALIVCAAIPTLATSASRKVKLSAAGKKALDQLVAQTQAENKLPGFALAVSSIDEQLYASAGGYKTFGVPSSGRVTPESVFWICSMTKLVTSIAGLQLIEQGKIRFDDLVTKYIPQFKEIVVLEGLSNPTGPQPFHNTSTVPTVGQLFNHSSGLTYWTKDAVPFYGLSSGYTFKQGPTREATTKAFFRQIQEDYPGIPLVFEPGAAFNYGYSSDVLGIVVEKATGISLAEYSKQHIFDPLGLKSSFRLNAETNRKLIDLNFRNTNGSVSPWDNRAGLIQRYPEEVYLALGGIGVYSTLPDYATLLRHLLKLEAGTKVSKPILKQRTVKTLFTPTLGESASASLIQTLQYVDPFTDASNYEDANWSTAFALATKDWPGRRRAGTGFSNMKLTLKPGSGWAGTYYLIDPTTGIAVVGGSQVVPFPDEVVIKFYNKAEEIVYANLE